MLILTIAAYREFYNYNKIQKLETTIERYNKTYLAKQGATTLYNGKMLSYNLRSFDGGKIWYACDFGDNWEIKVLGEAETIYPGLMKHVDGIARLTEYVEKHGSIDVANLSSETESILNEANIKIVKK